MSSIFRQVYQYEQKIIDGIFSNQNLLKLLSNPTTNEPIQTCNSVDNPYDLIDENIFFKPSAIDETTNITKSFLLINSETKTIPSSVAFGRSFIIFDIIVHKDINEIIVDSENRKRTRDVIILLDEYMNGLKLGVGNVMLEYEGASSSINKNYISRKLVYKLCDFNYNYKNKS